jgi:6-phosphofructokinase 2
MPRAAAGARIVAGMRPIVTLTMNPALDVSTEVPALVPTIKLRCGPVRHEAGGGGVNAARAITSLGGPALALYAAGGPTGAMLAPFLAHEGVPHRALPVAGATRENLAVLDRSRDELFRLVLPGPPMTRPEWLRCLDAAVAASEGCPYLVASGSLPPGVPDDFYARLARALQPTGTRLLLDCCGPPLRAALDDGRAHAIKPNFREFDELMGGELTDAEREEAAARLVEEGRAEAVIVTLGPRGALLVAGGERVTIAAPAVSRAGSPVGAGDCFMGALALALAQGRTLAAACALGVAAAAAAVMTPGTEPCRRDDVERLAAAMGQGASGGGADGPGARSGASAIR